MAFKEAQALSNWQQTQVPLLAAMLNYVNDGVTPFHTPGHKKGKGMHPALASIVGMPALALDLALTEELDRKSVV